MVEVKNFHFLKRPFLTKKGKWFFVTLRGGRGGGRASVTFVTKKMVFFFEGFPNSTFSRIGMDINTHLFSYCLLQLPNIWNPPDTVTHQEHPGNGQANLGVSHVPHLAGLLP